MWHIYNLESYSVVKDSDILNFACKWMELENTILSKVITQTQKNDMVCASSPQLMILEKLSDKVNPKKNIQNLLKMETDKNLEALGQE